MSLICNSSHQTKHLSKKKLNLPHTNSSYLVFLPLGNPPFLTFLSEKKKNPKKTNHKPLKVAASKALSSSVYVLGTNCFHECFHSM